MQRYTTDIQQKPLKVYLIFFLIDQCQKGIIPLPY